MRRSTFFTTLLSLCLLAPAGCALDVSEDAKDAEDLAETQSDLSPVCAKDAKQCSDGSWVSRTGPSCELAPCPTEPPPPSCWGAWLDENGLCRSPIDGVYPAECCAGPPPPPSCWGAWLDENGLCRSPIDGVYPAECCAGPQCGNAQCAAGEVCCNSLSGICTKPGQVCAF